jgi:hypothetical protein
MRAACCQALADYAPVIATETEQGPMFKILALADSTNLKEWGI